METEMEVLSAPCRHKDEVDQIFIHKNNYILFVRMSRKNCLDGTSRNEINEKNAAADDPSKCKRNAH